MATSSTARITLALLFTGLSALGGCARASDNMLVGKWHRATAGCGDEWEIYTDNSFAGYSQGWRHMGAAYNVSAEEIWVMPVENGHIESTLATRAFPIDANHFKEDSICGDTYERVDQVGVSEE